MKLKIQVIKNQNTFSEIILTHCEELELAELLDPSLRTTDVKKAKAANYICPKD